MIHMFSKWDFIIKTFLQDTQGKFERVIIRLEPEKNLSS